MDKAREEYLLATEYDLLSSSDKALKTKLLKYGSIADSMSNRDVGDLILGGYNGGIRQVPKGFAKWDKAELQGFAKSRRRDSRGRFTKTEVREETKDKV